MAIETFFTPTNDVDEQQFQSRKDIWLLD